MKYIIFRILKYVFVFTLLLFAGCARPDNSMGTFQLSLEEQGYNSPVYLTSPPGDQRLFVVDRIGVIKIIGRGTFLDIRDKIVNLTSNFDERGLLGLAFHPDYQQNGRFFIYYSAPPGPQTPDDWDHRSIISEFRVSADPDTADIASEKIIIQIDQPQFNHNGGQLMFGDDGYLYIALGDGGNANDVGLGHPEIGNAQDTQTPLGSILRIDIDHDPYGIPSDNPFTGMPGRDEIFAYGFRNPYRISFDAVTGDLFVGDVGQNLREEINIVEQGGNYGWNIREGKVCFDKDMPDSIAYSCPKTGYQGEEIIDPILDYENAGAGGIGLSVIGGFVYRGSQVQSLQGKYIFGDWSSSFSEGKGKIFVAEKSQTDWRITDTIDIGSFLLGFGQDNNNELYVLTSDNTGPTGSSGKVYRIA